MCGLGASRIPKDRSVLLQRDILLHLHYWTSSGVLCLARLVGRGPILSLCFLRCRRPRLCQCRHCAIRVLSDVHVIEARPNTIGRGSLRSSDGWCSDVALHLDGVPVLRRYARREHTRKIALRRHVLRSIRLRGTPRHEYEFPANERVDEQDSHLSQSYRYGTGHISTNVGTHRVMVVLCTPHRHSP